MNKYIQIALAFVFASSAAHANLVTNGSFETGDFSGWTANSGNTIDVNGFVGATNGIYAAQLSYSSNSATTSVDYLQQVINTIAGVTYVLDFDYKAAVKPGVEQTMAVSVSSGANTLASANLSDFGDGLVTGPWQHFSTTFLADSVSTTIKFLDTSATSFQINIAMDNVVVDARSTTTVPEPAGLALLGLGLAGIGVSRRKRL